MVYTANTEAKQMVIHQIFFVHQLLGISAMYHPESINGKFMKKYIQQQGEGKIESTINLGFIQFIFESEYKKVMDP